MGANNWRPGLNYRPTIGWLGPCIQLQFVLLVNQFKTSHLSHGVVVIRNNSLDMLFYFTFYFLAVRKQFYSNELVDMEVKSGQWIGGSVYSTGTNGRALVICLPFDP